MTKLLPSDPRYAAVAALLFQLERLLNPACWYDLRGIDPAVWRADHEAAADEIRARLGQLMRMGCDA